FHEHLLSSVEMNRLEMKPLQDRKSPAEKPPPDGKPQTLRTALGTSPSVTIWHRLWNLSKNRYN
ncbi:MAG TPA: hypothetical protein VF889_07365, partial [Bacteroidota bacterium]